MRLTDNVIGKILDRSEISDESRDYEFDGGVVSTVDVYPLLDRQESETLKAVGEWINHWAGSGQVKHVYGIHEFTDVLLKGEMPE